MIHPVCKLIAKKIRKQWKTNDDARDAKHNIPQTVEVLRDIPYTKKTDTWHLLDISRPKDTEGLLPCIVSFHGGGFFYGTKETYQFYAADLATRGFAVVNFNYRLCPDYNFPCQIEDCNAVLCWIQAHAAEYGIDSNNVFFVGDSAGGTLVLQYSALLTNAEYQKLFAFTVPDIRPNAVAMNCGLYQYIDLETDPLRKVYVNPKKNPAHIDIQQYVTRDFPPAYLASAPNDFLLDQMQPMANVITSHHVEAASKVYGTKDRPEACHVFHVNISLDIAKECNNDETAFFRRHMK